MNLTPIGSKGSGVAVVLCHSTCKDVFDCETILDETHSTEEITNDLRAAQASTDSLGKQIAGILNPN